MTSPTARNPEVSVLVAVHNGARHIEACLHSLLNQSFDHFEVIVIDDASTDGTHQLVEAYDDPRLTLLRLPCNQGPSAARNRGAAVARGRYLAILDADDVALPDRLARQVQFMDAHPEILLSGSFFRLESDYGTTARVTRPLDDKAIRRGLAQSCTIANTTAIIRRDAYLAHGGFPEHLRHGEDYRLFTDILRSGKAANIPEILVVKRERADGLTFRLSTPRHIWMGLTHRYYAVHRLRLGASAYALATVTALGIGAVRALGLNRETIKKVMTMGRKP